MTKLKQVAVIGLGVVGFEAALTVAEGGITVIAIDREESAVSKIDRLGKPNIVGIVMDATNINALENNGIKDVDIAFVTTNDLADNVSIIQNLLDLGVGGIIARANSDRDARILKKIGATDVIFPSREAGVRVGNIIVARASHARVKDVIEFDPNISYRIEEISISKHMEGKSLGSLNLEKNYAVKILFIKTTEKKNIKKNGKNVEEETLACQLRPFDHILQPNDSIVIAGEEESINRLKREIGEKDIVGEGFGPRIR